MDLKNTALATLAGAITLFFMGFIIFALMGATSFVFNGPEASQMKSDFSIGALFLIEVFTALLITIIYQYWASIGTFMTGAKNGLWLGALLGLIVMADYFSATNFTSISGVIAYAVIHGIRTAVAGGVIGFVLGRMKAS